MKSQLSQRPKRSRTRNASSKVQSKRRLQKLEMRKEGVPTLHSKKKNGLTQAKPGKIETKRRAKKQTLKGAKTNGSAAEIIRAAGVAPAANKKPSAVRQDSKRTAGNVKQNGEAATAQSIAATAVNDRTVPFDWGLKWIDWPHSMMPTALMTTKDLMRRKSPMDLMAIGSRLALSSWLDVWLQVLEGQRHR
jgi:hypothetical protein